MTSLVVHVLSRLQSCWSCLEPLVPEETREQVINVRLLFCCRLASFFFPKGLLDHLNQPLRIV